jgi:hypothetical protein
MAQSPPSSGCLDWAGDVATNIETVCEKRASDIMPVDAAPPSTSPASAVNYRNTASRSPTTDESQTIFPTAPHASINITPTTATTATTDDIRIEGSEYGPIAEKAALRRTGETNPARENGQPRRSKFRVLAIMTALSVGGVYSN